MSVKSMGGVQLVLVVLASLLLTACAPIQTPAQTESSGKATELTIYSGRNENLVGPLLARYQETSGVTVNVRYGGTAELAATILEEGQNSPADVFFGQDAGALGALSLAGRFTQLPAVILDRVDPRFQSGSGDWVGASGRARVFVYNTEMLSMDELPNDIWELTDPKWKGKVGWAPTNGSFQAFVTAVRVLEGEERAREWLEAMIANDVQVYAKNTPIVEATGKGEVVLGLVNHYYLYRFLAEDPGFQAKNHHPAAGDAGAMINVAGAAVLDTAKDKAAAEAFVAFLLSDEAQIYFSEQTNEYPLVVGIPTTAEGLLPLADVNTPDIDLTDLDDLQGTLELLQEVNALQ
ncbi:MAG: iron ABC transporter substrate-binding protein [Caldilineaceae bacterium]|nr:iron ABC transporter substrate-binding protein [Caldilineaceae bacterium]